MTKENLCLSLASFRCDLPPTSLLQIIIRPSHLLESFPQFLSRHRARPAAFVPARLNFTLCVVARATRLRAAPPCSTPSVISRNIHHDGSASSREETRVVVGRRWHDPLARASRSPVRAGRDARTRSSRSGGTRGERTQRVLARARAIGRASAHRARRVDVWGSALSGG